MPGPQSAEVRVDSPIPRRTLLQLGVAAPVLALAACSTPTVAPGTTPVPTPSLSPPPTPARVNTERPKTKRSFGPNGTHYPADQLWLGETAETEIEIECTWVALTRVINSLTPEQVEKGV